MKTPVSKTPWKHYKPVATWLPVDVIEALQQISELNNVSVSAYIKAIIVDAVEEELNLLAVKKSTPTNRVQVV